MNRLILAAWTDNGSRWEWKIYVRQHGFHPQLEAPILGDEGTLYEMQAQVARFASEQRDKERERNKAIMRQQSEQAAERDRLGLTTREYRKLLKKRTS